MKQHVTNWNWFISFSMEHMTTSWQRGNGLAFSVKCMLFLGQLSDCQLSASHEEPRSMELMCNQLKPINCYILRILKRTVTRWCHKFPSVSCNCQSVHWTHKLSVCPHRHHGGSTSVASQRDSRLCSPTRIPLSVSDFSEVTAGRQAGRRQDRRNSPSHVLRLSTLP